MTNSFTKQFHKTSASKKVRLIKVTFEYEAGSNGAYSFVIGNGENSRRSKLTKYDLENTWENSSTPKKVSFYVTGEKGGNTWIGIYSNARGADTKRSYR